MPKSHHILSSIPVPLPYGAHVVDQGVQFTICSRHATRVWLMLFDHPDQADPTREFELSPDDHRIGDLWHIHIGDAHAGQYYLYRMDGKSPEGIENAFDPSQWLLDPYATAIAGSPEWGSDWGIKKGHHPRNGAKFPKCVIQSDDFDWSEDVKHDIPLQDSIIYETHVRGYTRHPSSGSEHPGTYRGIIDKIPYLQELGITTVELLPVHEFNEMEYLHESGPRSNHRNYWGYSTISFFAPMSRYSHAGVHGQQVREFKEMVLALHKAGMEVILDVVFNHTAEGGYGGPVYSFRGIDNSIYYMLEEDGKNYRNYTGCGNTVNCNHPIVRDLILDALRYWVVHMHVDGFRFDLASILTRDQNGDALPNPAVVERIAEDPVLRDTKLIAEAWDAAGLYQVGSFPNKHWSEWNGQFRDNMREFWRGDENHLRLFADRFTGSPEMYNQHGQTPLKSINFITCHDGFTMNDLVSYNKKYNLANGEDNRDGESHNRSYNYGHEGPARDGIIQAVRIRQMKNFFATTLLAQGVPMLLAGDEFANSQQGNNNAYCQDSELSWLDWSGIEQYPDLLRFVRDAIAFRKAHPVLKQTRFLKAEAAEGYLPDISWHGPDGHEPNWDEGSALACLLNGSKVSPQRPDHLFMVFNPADTAATFTIPTHLQKKWKVGLSTQETPPKLGPQGKKITVDSRSTVVLIPA